MTQEDGERIAQRISHPSQQPEPTLLGGSLIGPSREKFFGDLDILFKDAEHDRHRNWEFFLYRPWNHILTTWCLTYTGHGSLACGPQHPLLNRRHDDLKVTKYCIPDFVIMHLAEDASHQLVGTILFIVEVKPLPVYPWDTDEAYQRSVAVLINSALTEQARAQARLAFIRHTHQNIVQSLLVCGVWWYHHTFYRSDFADLHQGYQEPYVGSGLVLQTSAIQGKRKRGRTSWPDSGSQVPGDTTKPDSKKQRMDQQSGGILNNVHSNRDKVSEVHHVFYLPRMENKLNPMLQSFFETVVRDAAVDIAKEDFQTSWFDLPSHLVGRSLELSDCRAPNFTLPKCDQALDTLSRMLEQLTLIHVDGSEEEVITIVEGTIEPAKLQAARTANVLDEMVSISLDDKIVEPTTTLFNASSDVVGPRNRDPPVLMDAQLRAAYTQLGLPLPQPMGTPRTTRREDIDKNRLATTNARGSQPKMLPHPHTPDIARHLQQDSVQATDRPDSLTDQDSYPDRGRKLKDEPRAEAGPSKPRKARQVVYTAPTARELQEAGIPVRGPTRTYFNTSGRGARGDIHADLLSALATTKEAQVQPYSSFDPGNLSPYKKDTWLEVHGQDSESEDGSEEDHHRPH